MAMEIETHDPKARVAELLIKRVDDAGMVRPKKTTTSDFEEMRKRLCVHLAYLCADSLVALADYVINIGGGAFKHEWPPEATIRAYAHGLRKPPITQQPIVTSWLASVEGPQAVAGGFEVELFRLLQRTPVPPTGFRMREVRDEAAESARRIELVRGRIDRGNATPEDRAWLEAYLRDQRLVREIVNAGQNKRAAACADGEAA